jgi:hypothetical protein
MHQFVSVSTAFEFVVRRKTRLWNIDQASCVLLLESMVAEGFLVRSGDRYRRA